MVWRNTEGIYERKTLFWMKKEANQASFKGTRTGPLSEASFLTFQKPTQFMLGVPLPLPFGLTCLPLVFGLSRAETSTPPCFDHVAPTGCR